MIDSHDKNKKKELNDILHKLNQPLTAISNYAQAGSALLAAGQPDHERLQELFAKIADQSARSFEISRELQYIALNSKPPTSDN